MTSSFHLPFTIYHLPFLASFAEILIPKATGFCPQLTTENCKLKTAARRDA